MKKYMLNGEIADFEYHSNFFDVCSPKGLKKFLKTLEKGERAEIEINSPGGLVIYGIEMANAIKNSEAHIVAHVTGMAASMASVIACACDEIVMEEASFMMIHDPWGSAEGNAEEMRKEAKLLDQMKEVCMSFYLSKFDRTKEELTALMSDETWYTGAECLENGLKCTVVKSDLKAAASVAESRFSKVPEAAAAFMRVNPLTDEQKALVAAAKAEQAAEEPAEQAAEEPAEQAAEPPAEEPAATVEAPAESAAAEPPPASHDAPAQPGEKPAAPVSTWESRFRGASKKINELQADLAASRDSAANLQSQLDQSRRDLDSARAEVEQLKAAVDEGAKNLAAKDKDLADARNSLAKAESEVKRLKNGRQLLTAGVLTQTEDTFDARLDSAKSPEEREAIRAEKKKALKKA